MPSTSKSQISPIYALVGSDPFLQLEALKEILASFPEPPQRSDFEGEKAELAAVLDEFRCFSMFASTKLVVVREADEFLSKYREKLEDFVNTLEGVAGGGGGATLILRLSSLPANQRIYKAIAKVGEVRKCDPPKEADLPLWIIARTKNVHQMYIERTAAQQLAELIGQDLGRLDSELSKLAIGATSGTITSADVISTVSFQREQEIWEITTLLGRGQAAAAVGRWRELVRSDPSTEFRAVTWLGIWLENCRTLLAAKEKGTPLGVVGKQIRIWDDKVLKDFANTATQMGKAGVARNLERLTDIDRRVKSGLGQAAENIERFIATALDKD